MVKMKTRTVSFIAEINWDSKECLKSGKLFVSIEQDIRPKMLICPTSPSSYNFEKRETIV